MFSFSNNIFNNANNVTNNLNANQNDNDRYILVDRSRCFNTSFISWVELSDSVTFVSLSYGIPACVHQNPSRILHSVFIPNSPNTKIDFPSSSHSSILLTILVRFHRN